MSTAKKHPNRVPFAGVLTKLDQPSDAAPSGARGHRVILTTEAAQEALPTLIGMAVAFAKEWDSHDARQKCGVITGAEIFGDELRVSGHVYCHDFPDVAKQMRKPGVKMGMSYEMVEAKVQDMRAEYWTLTEVTFTGAAILLRDKAAYRSTTVNLEASEERFTGKLSSDEGTISLLEDDYPV